MQLNTKYQFCGVSVNVPCVAKGIVEFIVLFWTISVNYILFGGKYVLFLAYFPKMKEDLSNQLCTCLVTSEPLRRFS
jgi:hypothetical protein